MKGLYLSMGIVPTVILSVLGAILIILLILTVAIYNQIVKRKNRVHNGYSQIDIQCKKRFDLVPNLVEVVKGYSKHESETLQNVINARNNGVLENNPSALAAANEKLTNSITNLFALSEEYPDLKANANFLRLQNELISIEKSIAISRGFYNDAVMMYNNKIMTFPNSIVAKLFKFEKAEFFQIKTSERENTNINL